MWILGLGPVNYLKEGQKRGRPKSLYYMTCFASGKV